MEMQGGWDGGCKVLVRERLEVRRGEEVSWGVAD